jgi:hypothetical protein
LSPPKKDLQETRPGKKKKKEKKKEKAEEKK